MALLNEQIKENILATPINNIFIDEYMLKANAIFVKVYIYGYRNCYDGKCAISFKQMAEDMDILESEVLLAWRYWQEKEIVKLHLNSETDTYDVEYLPLQVEPPNIQDKIQYNFISTKPTYLPQELDIYSKNDDRIRDLFKYSQKTLNKLLTYSDMNMIFSFYEWLRLPIDVIKIMLAYYCDKGMNYIEKIAITWQEEGIDTVDKAEQKISYNNQYRRIFKAIGLNGNINPNPKEIEFIEKWLEIYKFSIEIIEKACQRVPSSIVQYRFNYADGILKQWNKQEVKTVAEIEVLDNLHVQKQNTAVQNNTKNYSTFKNVKQNRFINYEQDDWDFERLEKLERQYIDYVDKSLNSKKI